MIGNSLTTMSWKRKNRLRTELYIGCRILHVDQTDGSVMLANLIIGLARLPSDAVKHI